MEKWHISILSEYSLSAIVYNKSILMALEQKGTLNVKIMRSENRTIKLMTNLMKALDEFRLKILTQKQQQTRVVILAV